MDIVTVLKHLDVHDHNTLRKLAKRDQFNLFT